MSSEVREIVRFVHSGEGERLMADVLEHDLPPVLEELVDEYVTFEGARDHFMWKWVHELAPQNTLPCVSPAYTDEVPTDKTITILFITLLDDVLEKRRDRATFEEASKIPFEHQSIDWDRDDIDREYVEFTERVWETLVGRIERAPEYPIYDGLFRYDVKQAINAIEYSNLAIDRPDLATLSDLERYESHNMVMFAYADIDLMHAPPEIGDELPTLRQAVWHAQQMARIGNWLSTWERELREGDFSSGVLVYALEQELVDVDELRAAANDATGEAHQRVTERVHDHDVEEVFLRRWNDHRGSLVDLSGEIASMDLDPYIEGLTEVLRYHLASKGLK